MTLTKGKEVNTDEASGLEGILERALNGLQIRHSNRIFGEAVLSICEHDSRLRFNILSAPDGTVRIWTHPVKDIRVPAEKMVLAAAAKAAATTKVNYKVTDDRDLNWEMWDQMDLPVEKSGKNSQKENERLSLRIARLVVDFISSLKQLRDEMKRSAEMC